MGMSPKNSDVKLTDILPPLEQKLVQDNMLTLTDIFVNEATVSSNQSDMFQRCSYEYDFVIPIDVEQALRKGVIELEVKVSNQSSPSSYFSTRISLLRAIGSTLDTGEGDVEGFIKKVKEYRTLRTSSRTRANKVFKGEVVGHEAISGNPSIYDATKGGRLSLDTAITGIVNKESRSPNIERDYYLIPPRTVTDGFLMQHGVSLSKIKEGIIEKEIEEGKYAVGSYQKAVETILEPDNSINESQEKVYFIGYSSPVIPVRSVFRVRSSTLDPTLSFNVSVKPILRENIKKYTGSEHIFRVPSRESELNNIKIPVGSPDIVMNGQGPGQIAFTLARTDPTLKKALAMITYFNPSDPYQIVETIQKEIIFTQCFASALITGIKNQYPLQPRLSIFTLDELGRSVKSKTINLKSFGSSISHMLPGIKMHKDTLSITALSTIQGVRLVLEGEIDRGERLSIYREAMSINPSSRTRILKIKELESFSDASLLDTNVVPDHTYRYYGVYERSTSARPFVLPKNEHDNYPRSPGQGVVSVSKHRTTKEAIVRYKKPRAQSGLYADTIKILTEGQIVKVSIPIRLASRGKDLVNLSDVLKYAKNSDAQIASSSGLNKQSLLESVYAGIVERIDRVKGEESVVGVFFVDESGESEIVDEDLFSNGESSRYTYKIKVCKPSIGGLYNLRIPIKKENQGISNNVEHIDAVKYTSNVFYEKGLIKNSAKVSEDYLEIIKSFDTGERIYVNYDPYDPNSYEQLVSLIQVRVSSTNKGNRITWTLPPELRSRIESFLVYQVGLGGKTLIGTQKSGFGDEQSFFHRVKNNYIMGDKSYALTPVAIGGTILPSTIAKSGNIEIISGIEKISSKIPLLDSSFSNPARINF